MSNPFLQTPISLIALSLCALVSPAGGQEMPNSPPTCLDRQLPSARIRTMISTEAARQGVDAKLALAIAQHESGFGAKNNSPAGARGIMQLMPATAERYGVTDVCDAAENIRGGVRLLGDLWVLFDGHVMLIAAAYNAGENRVITAGGIPPIAETVNYTALVTNTYFGFSNVISAHRPAARSAGKAQSEPTPDLLSVARSSATPDKPIPINSTRTEPAENTWLGGSVLYVQ